MSNVFSLADLRGKANTGTRYEEIEVYDGKLRLGTVSSLAVLAWVKENEEDEFAKNSGLRLLARTIVDAEGNRVSNHLPGTPEERADITAFVEDLLLKDSEDNGKAIKKALELNNLISERLREKLKNASGSTTTVEPPSDSQ